MTSLVLITSPIGIKYILMDNAGIAEQGTMWMPTLLSDMPLPALFNRTKLDEVVIKGNKHYYEPLYKKLSNYFEHSRVKLIAE